MSNILTGNIQNIEMIALSLTPVSVAANTTAEQSFTVPGLQVGDFVIVSRPAVTPAGISLNNSRVTAVNTLALIFGNHTAGALTPGAGLYRMVVFRSDAANPSVLPAGVMV